MEEGLDDLAHITYRKSKGKKTKRNARNLQVRAGEFNRSAVMHAFNTHEEDSLSQAKSPLFEASC